MDPRERIDELEEVIRLAIERYLTRVWTAMPVRVLADSEGHVTDLQPTIKGQKVNFKTNEVEHIEMPTLGMAPIHFKSGGGFTITHPVKAGDEGIAIFASRCIDGWWDQGGVQPALHTRRHNLSDAMYIPGVRSNPRKLGGNGADGKAASTPPSTNSIQIRTDSGQYYIELTEDSVNIVCKNCTITASENVVIKAAGKVHIETPLLEVTGEIRAGGDIHAFADVPPVATAAVPGAVGNTPPNADPRLAGGVSLTHHIHCDVWSGNDTTSKPCA